MDKTLEFEMLEPGSLLKTSWKKNGMSTEVSASTSEKDIIQATNIVLSHSSSEKGLEVENQQVGEKTIHRVCKAPNFSGPLMLPNRASASSLSAAIESSGGFRDYMDDKSKANLVQIKGRFSVTSENSDIVKVSLLRKSASVGEWAFESKEMSTSRSVKNMNKSTVPALQVLPHLQNLFQRTSTQQDLILNLLNNLQPAEMGDAAQNGKLLPLPQSSENYGNVKAATSERECLLLTKISELEARMTSLTDELNAENLKYILLQQHLNSISAHEEN